MCPTGRAAASFERAQADLAVRAEGVRPTVDREAVTVAPVAALGRDQGVSARDAAQGAGHDLFGV